MQEMGRPASDSGSSPRSRLSVHAVERDLSSMSALPTPRGIGSTLNVCVEGKFLGILMSGMVEKRREGAVRAGFARRLFLLSVRGCHYYRKADDSEIFGTERGYLALRDFGYAKVVPENEAPYGTVEPGVDGHYFVGLFSKQHTLTWFLRVDSMDSAKNWVTAIGAAQEIAKKNMYPIEWTSTMYNTFNSIFTGHPHPPATDNAAASVAALHSSHRDNESTLVLELPTVLAISIEQPLSSQHDANQQLRRERLVCRKVQLNQAYILGKTLTLDETLTVVLSNQQSVTHSLRSLRNAPSASAAIPIALTTSSFRIQASLSVTKSLNPAAPTTPLSPSSSAQSFSRDLLPTAPYNAAALGFSGLYILSCVLAYGFGPPFQGLMQITVILGAFLSASVVASAVLRYQELSQIKAAQAANASSSSASAFSALFVVTFTITKIEPVTPAASEVPQDMESSAAPAAAPTSAPAATPPQLAFSPRFIAAEKGNVEKGRARYESTLQWRRENNVDGMLQEPQPHFHLIKKYYPQYFHGKSIKGHCVYYEKVGKIDLKAMKAAGLTIDQLLRHYVYLTEYMWTILEPSDSGRSVTVLDVNGIGFYDLAGDVLLFVRQATGFVSANYPERSAQIFIVNVPTWFNMVWSVVSPMIDPVTKEKIRICKGRAVKEELLKSIAEDQLPADYGGSSVKLGESDEEVALAKYVDQALAASGHPN
ncbi:hypothetical protein H310_00028 [Aphanomyces invadans]|uniref:CRAL-TRIO domain-containing protein n=1 Tax=Aphanomyces invadans TaxID=157072 RepID=A0A024UU13_9STRA|nr:hypothetical protein H310_00028 [Aphanomyces invadans]ETW09420.1 hypothetical protein H310_00028 [Aphanomyces invadans]|eukprot:XP_008860831.1 hypothetical protein H310_00028 [Aphanomyces invadans]